MFPIPLTVPRMLSTYGWRGFGLRDCLKRSKRGRISCRNWHHIQHWKVKLGNIRFQWHFLVCNVRCNTVVVCFDIQFGVIAEDCFSGDYGFWLPDMFFAEEELPIQVAYVDGVQVDLTHIIKIYGGENEVYLQFLCFGSRTILDFSKFRSLYHQHQQLVGLLWVSPHELVLIRP